MRKERDDGGRSESDVAIYFLLIQKENCEITAN